MGTIISIEEFRKRRCLGALLEHIGLPVYCEDCDDYGEDLLLTDDGELVPVAPALPPTPRGPALILSFPPRAQPRRRAAARTPRIP